MTNILGLLNFVVFAFSAPSFSVGEILHVVYKSIKLKENLLLFGKYQIHFNISSRELKISEFSRVLCSRENSDVFNTLDEVYLVFISKKQISSIYLL